MRQKVAPDGTVLCPLRFKPTLETCLTCSLFGRLSTGRRGIAVHCRAPAPSQSRRFPGTQLAR